jgi:diguanylate cyclase (GGDEF)-like protein
MQNLTPKQCERLLKQAQIVYWRWHADRNSVDGPVELFELFDLPYQSHCTLENLLTKVYPSDLDIIYQAIHDAQSGHPNIEASFRVQHHDQRTLHIECLGQANYDDKGQLISIEGSAQNISRFHKAEQLPEYQKNHDPLTELLNRQGFYVAAQSFLQSHQRKPAALLIFDIDRFRQINESWGIETGDKVLINLAHRLKQITREHDLIARLNGDEFAILIKSYRDSEELHLLINRFMQDLSQPFWVQNQSMLFHFSLGIAVYPQDGHEINTLIQHANLARAAVKQAGGNGYRFYQPEMNAQAHQQLQLEVELQKALQNDQIQLLFQPQVWANSEAPYGAEALVRWHHPTLGTISPEQFIPIAESTGLILDLGYYIIDHAIQQAYQWQMNSSLPDLHIGINLSARQFSDPNLVKHISQALENYPCAARIDIEITESTAMRDVDETLATLQRLKALGVALSIDDFGTGYSSLAYLQTFPIDALKIDRAFVLALETPKGQALCNTIVSMGHNLKLKVIAEGIETESQAQFLRQAGCDIFQGFRYGKPMTADEFTENLQASFKPSKSR